MDYLKYWSLFDKPFQHPAVDRCFFGSSLREATAALHQMAAEDRPAAVLVSDGGCGATTLVSRLARTHGLGDRAVEIVITGPCDGGRAGVLESLAAGLGVAPPASIPIATIRSGTGAEQIQQRIKSALSVAHRQSIKVIWIIDDCSLPAARVASTLIAGTLIAGVPLFAAVAVCGHAGADQLGSLLAAGHPLGFTPKIRLEPLSFRETVEYVRESLREVGGRDEIWSESAVIRLYERGRGRLKVMSRVAEAAMRLAARNGMDLVAPAMVDAAMAEAFAGTSARAA